MKRSVGVTVAAIVMLLYGVVCFIAAVSLPIIISTHTSPTPPIMYVLRGTARAMFNETVAGIGFLITSYGIFRLRRWARISALSLSLGMIGFGAYLWIGVYLSLPNMAVSSVVSHEVLEQFLFIFVALAIPGVWWIALFTRPSVEAQFANAAPVSAQPMASEDVSPPQ